MMMMMRTGFHSGAENLEFIVGALNCHSDICFSLISWKRKGFKSR